MGSNTKTKKKFKAPSISKFPSVFFGNFKTIILTNLIFAIPLAFCFGLEMLFYYTIGLNIPLLLFPIVICFPFLAGVTLITRDISKNKTVNVWQTFKKGVKSNFVQFLIHGIIVYIATMVSYFSILFYFQGAKTIEMLYFLFGISVLLAIFFSMVALYLPIITVTLDLKMKYIYKNAALMSFGELPVNLLTLVCLGVLALFVLTMYLLPANYYIGNVVFALLIILIVPAAGSLIINMSLFPKVEEILIENTDSKDNTVKNESYKPDKVQEDNVSIPQNIVNKVANGGADEYIFYNGKMIKRAQIKDEYENIEE